MIDTGMLTEAYNGRPSALEIRGAQLSAIYEDGTVPLSVTSTPAIAVDDRPFRTAAARVVLSHL